MSWRLLVPLLVASVASAADPATAPAVRLASGSPFHLIAPGAPAPALVVTAGGQAVRGTLSVRIEEFDGQAASVRHVLALAAGSSVRLPLTTGTARSGIRWVDWNLADAVGARSGRTAFACAAPAGPGADPAGFFYGVSAHLWGAVDRRTQLDAMAAIGVGMVRWDLHWDRIEPRPGAWDWKTHDEVVALARERGMEFQFILGYGNPAYPPVDIPAEAQREPGRLIHAPPPDGPWRSFVASAVGRYHGQVRFWEVWNEPDLDTFFLGTPDDYLRLLRSAQQEVRKADPAAMVLSGGFATVKEHQGRRRHPEMQERVLAEASDAFDVHAFHGHGTFEDFRQQVEGRLAEQRARMATPRPLWFNETALTAVYHGERAQAAALVQKLAYARSLGALGFTWYDLRNDGRDPNDREHNYGLLTRDMEPKAVFVAYNELIRRMRGSRFAGTLDLGPGRLAYRFAAPGRQLVVAWNQERLADDAPAVLLAPGCRAARSSDLMGNARPLALHRQTLLLPLGEDPAYFELEGDDQAPDVLGPLVAVHGDRRAAPGELLALEAEVRNPLDQALAVNLAWEEGTARMSIPPGGTTRAALAIRCPPNASGRTLVELRYAVTGTPWDGILHLPLLVVRPIPAGDPARRPPDFTLADISSVVNFCDADPAHKHLTWQGPADLSARVWLERADGGLAVTVAVSDDIHRQDHPAAEMWRGDSVQLAMQVPGQRGWWELGAALDERGAVLRHCWIRPSDATTDDFSATVSRETGGLRYRLFLPYAVFGLDDRTLVQGFRFNLVVNDDDSGQREGFVRIAPGLGERKDPEAFPLVRFAPR